MRIVSNINIYDFTDYRAYLRQIYVDSKKRNSAFSYRLFSNLVGFSSPNYTKMIIDGTRNLTISNAQRLAEVLGLKGKQREYFESLVQWNQARNALDREIFYQKLSALVRRAPITSSLLAKEGLYSKWYYVVIREMVALDEFQADPEWIAKQLSGRITPADARDALHFLLSKQFIKKDDQKYQQSEPKIKSEDDISTENIRKFHRKMVMLGIEELSNSSVHDREVCSITLPVDSKRFKLIKQKIKDFLIELSQETQVDSSEEIAQLNIQLFKLTKRRPL